MISSPVFTLFLWLEGLCFGPFLVCLGLFSHLGGSFSGRILEFSFPGMDMALRNPEIYFSGSAEHTGRERAAVPVGTPGASTRGKAAATPTNLEILV